MNKNEFKWRIMEFRQDPQYPEYWSKEKSLGGISGTIVIYAKVSANNYLSKVKEGNLDGH